MNIATKTSVNEYPQDSETVPVFVKKTESMNPNRETSANESESG